MFDYCICEKSISIQVWSKEEDLGFSALVASQVQILPYTFRGDLCMGESLIEYGDDWSKIEERTIEFFAMMICCADHHVKLNNYSDIDEMRKADDFEDTMRGYRVLANKKVAELKLGLECSLGLISIIQELCAVILQYDFKDTESKVDFCKMLNEMDNKDLAFFKEVFTAISKLDINSMIKLKREVEGYLYG